MTETHTPYQRGRRAAERGAPRVVPDDIHKAHTGKDDWYRGWDSTKGTAATRGAHYQAGQFQAWDVTRYLSGDMAQAWQYVYRCGRKGSEQDAVTDLWKAVDFIEDWLRHIDVPRVDIPDTAWLAIEAMENTIPNWKVLSLGYIVAASIGGSASAAIKAKTTIIAEIVRREAA